MAKKLKIKHPVIAEQGLETSTLTLGTVVATGNASTTSAGLMSKEDKIKLDSIPEDVGSSKISGTVTATLGGITKGTVYADTEITQVLTDLLFPYVAPSWNNLTLYDSAEIPVSSTYEYGTAVTVAKFKPSFTAGSKSITSLYFGTTSGADDLYKGTTATSGTTYTLDSTKTKSYDGKTLGTNYLYCTLDDGTSSLSKSATIAFKYYNYYAVTNSSSAPKSASDSGVINIRDNTEVTCNPTDNSYVWFLVPNTNNTKIWQYASKTWTEVTPVYTETVKQFTTSTNQTVTYYAYRTPKLAKMDDAIFCLSNTRPTTNPN